MRNRFHAIATVALATVLSGTLLGAAPAVAADPLKVVIIVGPTGSLTSNYRSTGNEIASAAEAAGATVVKVYSPRATWARVRTAVSGANVVVYLGHGNGYPSPYSSTEWTDRVNGWGLNRTTAGGDSDDWSSKMVYCGEKALLGSLTASDGAAQWQYCGGASGTDGISPAPNWVMIYNQACYTPGASEGWDVKATESAAFQRVRNYSFPALQAGGGAYFATDIYHGAQQLVRLVLTQRDSTFGAIAEAADGYQLSAQRRFDHTDLAGRQVWIQRTTTGMGTDYWFAYAGNPNLTPSGAMGVYVPPPAPQVVGVAPVDAATGVSATTAIRATFDQAVRGAGSTSFLVRDAFGLTVPGSVSYYASKLRATFFPSSPLEAGITYTATLTGTIKNGLGVRLARLSWSFTVLGPVSATTTLFAQPQPLVLRAGTNTGYLFTRDGALRGTKTATLANDESAFTPVLRTLPSQAGRWYFVSDGTWAGYWFRDSSAVHLENELAAEPTTGQAFSPAVRVLIRRGTHTGYTFSGSGEMIAVKTATLLAGRYDWTTELRSLPGQAGSWFRLTTGPWQGYWLRASDVVYLD